MTYPGKLGLIGTLSLFFLVGTTTVAPATDAALAWPALTAQTRPWVWWWWHGSAVDKTNLTHELQRFHDAGLGGVQFTPIFGVKGQESQDISYLSPKWMAMMGYTVDEARRLGMGVDMTLGTGWCFGGPTVSGQDANASVVVKTFDVATGGKLEEKFDRNTTQALVAFSPDGKSVELTDKISADGTVDWTAPAGSWNVYAISQKPSGQKVKRAAPGGEGWMLNPIYPQSVRDWLPWFDKALAGYTGARPAAVFQDSYEYRTDWSPDFFAQFEKLRGYKLQAELPALFGNAQDDHTARVKADYRETVSDLMSEESEPAWIEWAHKNGFSTIYQAHGTPGNWLDLYADADIPETEMFHNDRSVLISKFASSAAHTQGHPLTGAETGTWLVEHFTETLAELKYLADDMFLSGINHIFYHGACYSPDEASWPGWLFYASTEMNPRNSIWHDVPTLNEYIARCQSVLQSGKPDNDILLYWPISDLWNNPAGRLQTMTVGQTSWFEDQSIGKTAHELWNRGYAFDYVSDRQLEAAKAADGKIEMPGGSYRVIVVPECKLMPVPTLQKLIELARSGATVIFEKQLPADVPGWDDLATRRAEFKKLCGQMQFSATGECVQGKGRIMKMPVETALPAAGIARETMADAGLVFIRRSFDRGNYYFIANRSGTNFNGWVTLGRSAKFVVAIRTPRDSTARSIVRPGRSAKSVVAMDALNGSVGIAASRPGAGNSMEVHLQLAPGESILLRAFAKQGVAGAPLNYWRTNGQAVEITGEWGVKFVQGGPTLPSDYQTKKLGSWTTLPDTNAQAFAGSANYTINFDAPAGGNKNYFLDLGDVRQSARVKLNGKDYGTIIAPPFRVVVDNLKPKDNKLEVEATNVSANRIRDLDRRGVEWKIFKDINIVNVNYRPFDASDWPLTDSGLLGPVTLTALTPFAN